VGDHRVLRKLFVSEGMASSYKWPLDCTAQTVTREDFGIAYEKGSSRTIRFLVSRGVPQEHAQDIAQTAWMRGWERLYQLRNEKLLSTWINSIALNTYRRALYRDRLFQRLSDSVCAETCINEASIDLSRIMSSCRPEERALLEAHLAGLTPEEIAAEDGVSRVAIRVRLWRARRAARQEVQRRVRVAELSSAAA
jgi:RNA polymerase sigma factor (sigma-70 family)